MGHWVIDMGRWINARYDGRCENFSECHNRIEAGDRVYHREGHTWCESCGELEAEEDAGK